MNLENIPRLSNDLVRMVGGDMVRNPMIYIYLGILGFEFLIGIYGAMKRGEYDTKIGREGIVEHSLVTLLVFFLVFFSKIFGYSEVGYGVIILLTFNNVGSIIENLELIGIEVPEAIKSKFARLNKKSKEDLTISSEDEFTIKKKED